MGCQPSRLVFTGLLFEVSRPGAGGTLLHLRPNRAPRRPALSACQLTAGASLLPPSPFCPSTTGHRSPRTGG